MPKGWRLVRLAHVNGYQRLETQSGWWNGTVGGVFVHAGAIGCTSIWRSLEPSSSQGIRERM